MCDGACSMNGRENSVGGWAATLISEGFDNLVISGTEKDSTNNRMELKACLEAIKRCGKKDHIIEVVSDSTYVVYPFTKGWIERWKKNNLSGRANSDIWRELIKVVNEYEFFGCKIIWTHLSESDDADVHDTHFKMDLLAKKQTKGG